METGNNSQNPNLEEWKEIRETIRHFGTKRFTQLTVFIAVSGFMINEFFTVNDSKIIPIISITGIAISLLFLLMEISSGAFWMKAVERGKELEGGANMPQLLKQGRPKRIRIILGDGSIYVFYICITALWIFLFCTVHVPSSKNSTIEKALNEIKKLRPNDKHTWTLESLEYDKLNQVYNTTFTDTSHKNFSKLYFMVDDKTGKILKVQEKDSLVKEMVIQNTVTTKPKPKQDNKQQKTGKP